MHEIVTNPIMPPAAGSESDHLIQTLVEKNGLNVVSPAPEIQISPGQLFMVDCRSSTPEQVLDWYAAKPTGTPFLLLSPEKEHLTSIASTCVINPTEAQYAVLYEITTEGGTCVTSLGYMITGKDEGPGVDIEPSANSKSTNYFMEAVRRSFEGLIKLDITSPAHPPKGMICSFPASQYTASQSILFQTDREPVESGTADNTSDTSFVSTYTPYLFLQQEEGGTENSQVLIIATEWNIISGGLYANDKHDRGNALCNMTGTLQPDPKNSSFVASTPPNDFSPKSGNGSFNASINETINYYDSNTGQTLGYNFIASAPYDIEDWAVSSNCTGTELGPNFYATQPTNCETYPATGAGFYDDTLKIHDLSPASCSGGTLNFGTYSSWQTKTNDLVPGKLTINSAWTAMVYRWYVDKGPWNTKDYRYGTSYPLPNQSFTVDFTYIQPPDQ